MSKNNDLLSSLESAGWGKEKTNKKDTLKVKTPKQVKKKKPAPVKKREKEIDFENQTGLPAKIMSMTIEELVKKFGTGKDFKEWTIAYKNIKTVDQIDVKTAEIRNQLIPKDFVVSTVFRFINQFMKSVFDSIQSQNETIVNLVLADVDKARKDIPKIRRDEITKISKKTKEQIKIGFKQLETRYGEEIDFYDGE